MYVGATTCLPNQFSHLPRHPWGKTQRLFGERLYRTMMKMIRSVGRDDSNWRLVISVRHETGGLSKTTSINLFGDPEWCRGYLKKKHQRIRRIRGSISLAKAKPQIHMFSRTIYVYMYVYVYIWWCDIYSTYIYIYYIYIQYSFTSRILQCIHIYSIFIYIYYMNI